MELIDIVDIKVLPDTDTNIQKCNIGFEIELSDLEIAESNLNMSINIKMKH